MGASISRGSIARPLGASYTLVANGGFDGTGSPWFIPAEITVSGGKLVYTTPGVTTTTFHQIYLIPGKTYNVTFTVEDYVLGTIRASLGGTLSPNRFANGTFTEPLTAGSANSRIALVSNGNADFKIDNVSVVPA